MIQLRGDGTGPDARVFEALADRRRREVLRCLDATAALHVEDLVDALVGSGPWAAAPECVADPADVRVELRHRHLPKLARADLVSWSGDRVALADVDEALLGALLGVEADGWDAVLACLSSHRRRAVLAALSAAGEPLDVTALAFEVLDRDAADDAADVDRTLLDLRHVHLPKLADAGLVAVEDCGTTVRYLGHPALEDLARRRGADSPREVPL